MSTRTRSTAWWKEPTRPQWISFGSAWTGWVLDSFDFWIYVFVAVEIAKEFDSTVGVVLGSMTLTLLVRLLGGFAAGWAADKWGRKLPFLLSMLWFAVFDGLVAVAPSLTWIIIFRTLFGFGMGAEWASGTTLAMENWPQSSRRIASGILQGSWGIGFCLAALANWLVVPAFGWRALFVLAAIPALLVLPMRAWVPESKEWLEHKLAGTTARLRDLLEPVLLKNMLWTSLTLGFGFCVYYAVTLLYPAMLAVELHQSSRDIFVLTLLFNLGFLVGAVVCGAIAKRFGVTIAVVVPSLLGIPLLALYVGRVDGLLAVGAFLTGAISVGWSGTVPAFLTGLYPARIRAVATGVTYHAGAFCAALVPTVSLLLKERGMSAASSIFWMATVAELGLVVFLLARRPETIQRENEAADARRLAAGGTELPRAINLKVGS